MPSAKNTRKKKKIVAAILLLLCMAMLALLLLLKTQDSGTGGGGGGGGGAAVPPAAAPVQEQAAPAQQPAPEAAQTPAPESGQPAAGTPAPATDSAPAPAPAADSASASAAASVAEKADVPALAVLSWQPYDANRVVYSVHRVIIRDATGKEVARKDLEASETKLPLDGLGLEENKLYTYQVAPVSLPDTDLSHVVRVHKGPFYVNLVDERPGAPVLLSPAEKTNVSTSTPVVEWKASVDPDPHETAKLRYKVTLSRSGAGDVWSMETADTQLEVGEALRENTTYTVTVVAIDPKGLESAPAGSTFSVDASREKPNVPTNPRIKVDVAKNSWLLDWGRSSDPNPGGSVVSYHVAIKDADSGVVVLETSTRNTYIGYPDGEYGKNYAFRVQAKNNFGVLSRASAWSAPSKYVLNYTCVPQLIRPGKNNDLVSAKVGLSWAACDDAVGYTVKIGDQEYETTEIAFPFEKLQKEGVVKLADAYPVQVRVTNASGFTSAYSDVRVFVVADSKPDAPGAVVASNTLDGTDETEREDSLSWAPASDLEGAVSYEVQISSAEDFAAPEIAQATENTIVTFDEFWKQWRKLEGNKSYHVRVVAIDSAGNRVAGKAKPYIKTEN